LNTHCVLWFSPIGEAGEGLNYLDRLGVFGKGTYRIFISKLLTWLERLWLEKFAPSHE
jgi:hypothetical protein